MQKINNLEDWETKAKQYNPRAGTGWLWAIAVALILLAFALPYTYAAEPCVLIDEGSIRNGTETHGIFPVRFFAMEGDTVIEVKTGGYYGEGRDYCINLESGATIEAYIQVNNRTAPIYIICYKADVTATSGENGCWNKDNTTEIFSLFSDQDNSNNNTLEYSVSNVNNTLSGEITANGTQALTRIYTNYPATIDNPFILGLGWLLLAFGIFLSFSFVFAMFKR